ncbi:MAG TPA: glycosyltransferase [Longimicrobium sp.]|nr:glycosyltransferase [Longimicrobium sp.]
MKIVRYHPRAAVGDGGITGSVRRWSAAFARAGVDAVIAHDGGVPPPADPGVRWVDVRHAGPEGWRVPRGLERVLDGADLLVLHSAWTVHNAFAGAVARGRGIPYVLEPRGAYDPGIVHRRPALKRAWWMLLESPLVRGAAAIHAFFPSEAKHLAALGWTGPVIVAPNGVRIPEGVRWDGGSGGYVLWIGRFDPEHKGLGVLLRALALLPADERPALRLHGPDWRGGKQRTARIVGELGLERWVTVGEPVYGDEKWALMEHAAAFTYPSRWEAFGNSTAEAVAAGVPTLATPYPLGCFLAERGGAVVARATPEGLAEGLRRLRRPEMAEIARRGARLVKEEMSWDRVAERWLAQARALV